MYNTRLFSAYSLRLGFRPVGLSLGLDVQVSVLDVQVSVLEFQVSVLKFQVSVFDLQVLVLVLQVSVSVSVLVSDIVVSTT